MKLLNTNGQTYNIQPMDYISNKSDKSKGHLLARKLLKEKYPFDWVLEEVPVKIGKQTLFADFLVKGPDIIVEVQGKQHGEYISFFHQSKADFKKGQIRDNQKKYWCEFNNLNLIELVDGEKENEWREKLGLC